MHRNRGRIVAAAPSWRERGAGRADSKSDFA
jgi:hypothetical protein